MCHEPLSIVANTAAMAVSLQRQLCGSCALVSNHLNRLPCCNRTPGRCFVRDYSLWNAFCIKKWQDGCQRSYGSHIIVDCWNHNQTSLICYWQLNLPARRLRFRYDTLSIYLNLNLGLFES